MDLRVHWAGVVCLGLIPLRLFRGWYYLFFLKIFVRIGLKFGRAPLAAEIERLSVVICGCRLRGVNLHPANRILQKLLRRINHSRHRGAFHQSFVLRVEP